MTERVQVVVRIRPFIPSDPPDAELNAIVLDDTHVSVGKSRVFKVDRVFMMETESEEIYNETVAPLVDRFIAGCNASVLAYGQTGTGKTYTVQTMLPLILTQVLESSTIREGLSLSRHTDQREAQPLVQLQYVEVYGDTIRDLLEGPSTRLDSIKQNKLHLVTTTIAPPPQANGAEKKREDAPFSFPSPISGEARSSCSVVGATIAPVYTVKDAASLIALGDARRATGATNVHERSSRSHAILTLFHPRYSCQLDIVDLAGSEREKKTGNTGLRFQESIAINSGLLALGNVIRALSRNHRASLLKENNNNIGSGVAGAHYRSHSPRDRLTLKPLATRTDVNSGNISSAQHVPYRSSKLTRLLQNTLGGSSATLFIACIAPDSHSRDETLRTLQYCALALQVLNEPIRQYDRLQRAQSCGRGGPHRSAGNSPSSEAYEDEVYEAGREHTPSRNAATRIEELQSAYTLLQKQYDEQGEVLASICESYAEAKERLELWEKELRKDGDLFTQQMRGMQLLVQENQKLRHRLVKMKAASKLNSERLRGGVHRDVCAGVEGVNDAYTTAIKRGISSARSVRDDQDELHNEAAALLQTLREHHDADVVQHNEGDLLGMGPSAEGGTATAGPLPISVFSPYRHLNLKPETALQEGFDVNGMRGKPAEAQLNGASTPGAASAATSEPVRSFIRSLLRQHGILTGKENAERANAVLSPPTLHDMTDADDVLHQRPLHGTAQRATALLMEDAKSNAGNPSPHQALLNPVDEGGKTATTRASFSRLHTPLHTRAQEMDGTRSPQRELQLLQLAHEVLRYEETNADLRNEVRLLQAKLDDKTREAARLRLEVQDMKDAYSSLSVMTE